MRPHPTGSGKAGRDPTGSRLQPVPGNSSLSKDGKDLKKNQKERCREGRGGGVCVWGSRCVKCPLKLTSEGCTFRPKTVQGEFTLGE